MFWQPSNAVASGALSIGGAKNTLRLEPDQARVECVWGRVPLGSEFRCDFDFRLIAAPIGAPCVVWQLHDGSDVGALNPIAALEFTNAAARIVYRHHVAEPVLKADVVTWIMQAGDISAKWDIHGRHDLADGWLRVRRNGVLVLDYAGPLGFNLPQPAYQKRGLYSWVPRATAFVAEVSA